MDHHAKTELWDVKDSFNPARSAIVGIDFGSLFSSITPFIIDGVNIKNKKIKEHQTVALLFGIRRNSRQKLSRTIRKVTITKSLLQL